MLDRIPAAARIPLIQDGRVWPRPSVREAYRRLRPLEKLRAEKRGWTLDVLAALQTLGKREFSLDEAHSLMPSLSALHPDNRHVGPKIRQQLQLLRNMGLLEFLGRGRYHLS